MRHEATDKGAPIVQLATRIPKELHRTVKLHVVRQEVAIQTFVEAALREKLKRETRAS